MLINIKDPKPEIMRLEELALLVKAGEIKLPRFQRPFVWKKPDMLKLLDSIYKGYPIGSILIWNSSQRLMSERSILGFDVNIEDNVFYPTNYLLDGQQRLTTLCGALFWQGGDLTSIWNIYFDIEKEEFVYSQSPDIVTLFPLNKLIKVSDFIKQCMKFNYHEKRDEYYSIAERLLKSIKDYKIAVVKIGDMTIDEVAPIFERINSTGRQLTIVDLMMAATWSDGFDLTSEIKKIKNYINDIGFELSSDQIILRSISASANLGINKDDIQKLRLKKPEELKQACDEARRSLCSALVFLRDYIGIHDVSYIPYAFQLTYLAEFFRNAPDPRHMVGHIVEWFWYTSATRYFASANTGQVAKDLAQMRQFALGLNNTLFDSRDIDISQLLFDKFNLRNATSTTFTVLLNSTNPSSALDGKPIDGSHLKVKSSKFFKSFTPVNGVVEKLNVAKIIYPYDENPEEYVPLDINPDLLLSHFLDSDTLSAITDNDAIAFIWSRARMIATKLQQLTGCTVSYSLTDSITERMLFPNSIDAGDFDNGEEVVEG